MDLQLVNLTFIASCANLAVVHLLEVVNLFSGDLTGFVWDSSFSAVLQFFLPFSGTIVLFFSS